MSTYLVCKPFQAGSSHLKPGDVVDGSSFVHLQKLLDQRYLAPSEAESAAPVVALKPAPAPAPTVPVAKKRGRPRKVSAAEQPSE
jgi:ABC-type Fe3+ transport system substrate-binding protein